MKKCLKTLSLILTVIVAVFAMASCDAVMDSMDSMLGGFNSILDKIPGFGSGNTGETVCEHSWVDATCKEAKHCELCGNTEGEALAHTPEAVKGSEPTCTVAGKTDGEACKVCGEVIVAQETIAAKGHTEGAAATCTADQTCTVCGEVIVEKHHTPVTVKGYAATCTEAGQTDGEKCDACGEELVAQEPIAAKGHTEGAKETCTTDKTCTECGEVLEEKHHTPIDVKGYAATCTEDGKTDGVKCDACGEVLVAQEPIAAKGHTEGAKETCTSDKICTVCGDVLVERHHTPITVKGYAATCTEAGQTDGEKCDACGEVLVAQEPIAAKGHTEGAAATCTTDQTCTVCGTVIVEKHHTAIEVVKGYDATCTATGKTDGEKCTDCGRTLVYQTTISKKPHTEEEIPGVAPTCYVDGLTAGVKCSVCELVITAQTVDPSKGHSFADGNCTACGQGYYNEGMVFTLSSTEDYYILERLGTLEHKDIVIPSTYKDLPVKTIGSYFTYYNNYKSSIETITIPSSITTIEAPTSVEAKKSPFYGCTNLKKVYIESMDAWFNTKIGTISGTNPLCNGADLYCNGELVTEVTVPGSIEQIIDVDYFEGCTSITKVNFHDKLYVLNGFKNLPNLTEVTIPSSVKIILGGSFVGCTSLSEIDIPVKTYHIFEGAFNNTAYYNNAENWDGGNVLYIGKHLIKAKTSISGEYTVKAGTTSISPSAFASCTSLTALTLNSELITIGNNAFNNTSKLKSITIPASVRYIGSSAFERMYANNYGKEIIFEFYGPWYEHGNFYSGLSSSSYISGSKNSAIVYYYLNNEKITGGTAFGMSVINDYTHSRAICR